MEQAIRRLMRSNRDRVFGGICGGLAHYLEVDVVIVRIAYVALTLFSLGTGILLYLIAWIVIPLEKWEEPLPAAASPVRSHKAPNMRFMVGIFLIIAGILALVSIFLPWFWSFSTLRIVGPILLVVLGGTLIFARTNRQHALTSDGDEISAPNADEPKADHRTRRLTRQHQGRKIAGICAGFGKYFDLDPTIIRVLWLVLIFVYGTGILLYLLCWLILPLEE
jgi:phage shock protein C